MTILRVWYDDFELTKYLLIKRIVPLTATRNISYSQKNNVNGRYFKGVQDEGLTIKIEAYIRENVMAARDELAKIFYSSNEPKPLVISDYPNRALMCVLEGGLEPSSRFRNATINLIFSSPNSYWISLSPTKVFQATSDGTITVNNQGTYWSAPRFNINFTQECGYIGVVSPFGHIGIGNQKELDKIPVPPSEVAIHDKQTDFNTWNRIPNAQNYITDYIGMTSTGHAKYDNWGMHIDRSSLLNAPQNKWIGHAYTKEFSQGTVEKKADNFSCLISFEMQETDNTTANTGAVLFVVMDENHKPIMTTSIYNVSGDTNELSTSFKMNSLGTDRNHSKIIHRGSLSEMLGYVQMKKMGDTFEWVIFSDSKQKTTYKRGLEINEVVYIKESAKYGYGEDPYTKVSIKDFTRGRTYRIGAIRDTRNGKQYRIDYQNTPIYWVFDSDLSYNRMTEMVQPSKKVIRHKITHEGLASMKPTRVFIWQAVWSGTRQYSRFNIINCRVDRIYTTNALEIENVFRPGDRLTIDCQTSDILLNGTVFQGHVDVSSRFFQLPYGKTDLQVMKSNWADMPKVTMELEERFV